ncbi:MAG TPA: APC family permease [Candidatus Sulfotelmatobacter sp.]|nr:APC family permease [Candidatus Sulfotelmatobacter sp.]
MITVRDLKTLIVGKAKDALAPEARRHMVLAAFLAWIGLGADGLSSANYGPEEAFIALGAHSHMALYIAGATAITVFLIAMAYNQVIELFPSGGGGYKVATVLIGPYAGLVGGAALIVDYVLTIAISIASGVDALFSLLPLDFQGAKLAVELFVTLVLLVLNLRGVKEPVRVLIPIFLGFVISHAALIVYGITVHAAAIPALGPSTFAETRSLAGAIGWAAVLSLMLRAYSLGGGTYTGIEAVSNNVNILKEPRVQTGRLTMLYMALSLSFMAGGLLLLYLLWGTRPQPGQTLNAVVFAQILHNIYPGAVHLERIVLLVVLVFAASILFVAANTGFLGGPAVLANMAADRWVPHQFANLSNRLVTQNGIILMGVAALATLVVTDGRVSMLVVLYSINVFITFTLCLLGLCIYWGRRHDPTQPRFGRLSHAFAAFVVAAFILGVTVVEKFTEGGWLTLLVTSCVIVLGVVIRRHYSFTARELAKADALFATAMPNGKRQPELACDPTQSTAVFLVGRSLGTGMHTLLSLRRLFPNQFKNFVFVSVGEIDSGSFHGEEMLNHLRKDVRATLDHYVGYCQQRGLPATAYEGYGPDVLAELTRLIDQVIARFPNSVFFASKLIFDRETWFVRQLHNGTALTMQQELHKRGIPMVILPMNV